MLDRRTSALLQTINDFCASGTYKVFSSEDFLASFPEKWGVTSESLAQMLGYLSENGYINIKYSGSGMYCICPLPLGRSYCEREAEKKDECAVQVRYFVGAAFFGAFAGAVLGTLTFTLLKLIFR